MKLIRWAAIFVALTAILLSGVGCQEKTSTGNNNNNDATVGSIQIVTGTTNDTLYFIPSDSASTNVTIIVTDTRGLALPGVRVDISLANSNLGVIEYVDASLRDTTNALGRVNCVFRTYAQAGDQIITASTSGVSASRILVIRPLQGSVNAVTMMVTPAQLEASPLAEDSAQIDVTIVDASNRGVPNVSLNLSATGGRLVIAPATDSTGRTSTYWFNNREFGDFWIFVRAGTLVDSALINVTEVPAEYGTLRLATSALQVEADGCISAAQISATVKNVFGEAIINDTVRFGAPELGSIQPWALTDSLGTAHLQFCGMSIPNNQDITDSSMVVARYERWGLRDTVNVRIIPAAGIGNINLGVSNTTGIAGVDSIGLNLFVQFANGQAVNGYWAKFRAQPCGFFRHDSLRLVNGRPDSSNYFYLCQAIPSTPVELTVEVDNHFSDPVSILIRPGDPNRVNLGNIPPTTINTPVTVTCCITDTFNNRVGPGVTVGFLTTLGSVPSYWNTDADGCARPSLNPGSSAGIGLVRSFLPAGSDTAITTLVVTAGTTNSVTGALVPPSLLAQGSGGQDWAQIEARLYDANGNPVEDGTWARFRIVNGPAGANINGHGTSDSAQTANGLAVATLNAGTQTGPIQISVCGVVNGTEQCVPVSGSIVSGPPAEINIGVNEIGVDAGGGTWDLAVSALVKDAVQNDVIDGTAVFFEVAPNDLAQILSEAVVVGNQNVDGEVHPGVAYTTMRYNSVVTNQIVVITARTANGIQETFEVVLPIQEPALTLDALPGSWHFVANGNPCVIELRAIVRDGHQVLINGQQVYYNAQRGRMYGNAQGSGPTISIDFTGPDFSEPDGQCSIWLREDVGFIFPDDITPEIPGEVRAEVVGYPDATESQVINFRR